jgi:hypothetical protein
MKCRFCIETFDEIKKLNTHADIDHPNEKAKIDSYLHEVDLKLNSVAFGTIESTSMYRHTRQPATLEVARKEET